MKGKQYQILVVDDERDICRALDFLLSREGYKVATAYSGPDAVKKIETEKFDLVISDLKMEGMTGMEVLEKALAIDPSLIFIIMTAFASVESAVEAMKKGAYDFVLKPFTPDQLGIVVRRALEKRTLQKEAEFLRREREKSLRDIATEKSKVKTIINCMGDGVLVCDGDGCIVLSNPAASRMLKISESSLLGNFLPQCNLHSELSKTIQESLTTKDVSYTSVSQELGIGESGESFLRAHTAPVKNDLGETMGSVTVLQDISHLKELDKMKSEFIAMVTRELRAPIAAVEQQLTVILNKMAGEVTEKQEKLLHRAKERTKGLLDLIRDLLDLSKIEAGKMVQYKEPLDLQEVIQRVVDLMKAQAENKKIDLQLLPPSQLSLIHADRTSKEGIFTNLISNAIKYTPEGGKVWVDLAEEGGFVKASVSDTGIGIKKEDLSRIFDKFYRVKSSETRQIVGTGLGLSIVKSIVDAHAGRLWAESQPGKGARISFALPVDLRKI